MENEGKNAIQLSRDLLAELLTTRQQQKLIEASVRIRMEPDAAEIAYLARHLVLATLPHSDPGDVPAWRRVSGGRAFILQPGIDGFTGHSVGIPFGVIPRLLLYWVVTEAVRNKSPILNLGDSLADFMRDLGLDPSRGGKRSDAYRLRDQANRLFSSSVFFQERATQGAGIVETKGAMPITRQTKLWWSPRDPHAPTLWGSWVELGADFYQAIIAAPVPLDVRALRALRRSPLALDLYALMSYRSFVASRRQEDQCCTWADLHQQLGADYADLKDFRRKCVSALQKIATVTPGLKMRRDVGGITILSSSRPAIGPR